MTEETDANTFDEETIAHTDEETEARARELLARMSLDEKISTMGGAGDFWTGMAGVFSGDFSQFAWQPGGETRLGLPGILFSDGPRGVVRPGTTTFPVAMARGASWDDDLEERIGDAMGREARATGRNLLGSVCINLLRHPAWGRAQETYGEDTHHLGVMGVAHALGVQNHVMACVKHYALNSIENARFKVDVTADERTMREVYLPHFKRVVDAGVASVMSAYNSVNGEWCGQNKALLRDILKDEWGFGGFVITDFMFGLRDAKKGILAGQDLEMPFHNHYHRFLEGLVENGEVSVELVDDAALRLLRQQVRFLEGADGEEYGDGVVGREEHRALAREAAEKGIVLLKNEGDLLPLKDVKRVAVVGRLADTPNTGDHGGSDTRPEYVVTPLEGLRHALGDEVEISHDDGSDAARAARTAENADAVICVVGNDWQDEGEYLAPSDMERLASIFPPPSTPEEERISQAMLQSMSNTTDEGAQGGDRASLTLHEEDEALIHAVASANPRTVVAIMAGGAVITEAWRDEVPAVLMLWYPGMEGGNAFADVLLGHVNPSGKLTCTFPKAAEDLPHFDKDAEEITYDLWHGYRKLERDGSEPAFPFGFGLSYTDFAYDNLRLESDRLGVDDTLVATVDVANTGDVAGEEVVQLYAAAQGSAVERAPKELKAFARVPLSSRETRSVRLAVPIEDLAYYDAGSGWVLEPITYEAIVGRSADDPHAPRAAFRID